MGYFLSLSKSDATSWLSASEWTLLISGIVLAMGIIGEIRAWMWGSWKKRFEYMVLLGVMGELIADGGVFFFSSQLQTVTDAEVARLNVEAGEARKVAGNADERSKALEQENLLLQAEVLKLQDAALWRNFTKEQSDTLISLAKKNLVRAPTFTVLFDSVVGNPEAKRYGGQIAPALSVALGLTIDKPLGLSTCLECTGVWVCIDKSAEAMLSNDGKGVRKLLELSGVKGTKFCTGPKNGQGGPTVIKIVVGPKE